VARSLSGVERDIERWLLRSAMAEPSVALLRPRLGRWATRLRSMGVQTIPQMPSSNPADARATNLLNQFVHEAMVKRIAETEHRLRNLTGVRPFKFRS
jgi:hypothetical protein